MADGLDFSINGLESLRAKLNEVSVDMRYRGGRSALRKAALLVVEKAQANASRIDDPQTAESISANIAARWNGRRYKRTGDPAFRIGVLGGARAPAIASGELKGAGKDNPGGDTYYWRFLEFGTSRMRAQPFMRQALEGNIGAITDTFVTTYDKALAAALRRAERKAAKARGR